MVTHDLREAFTLGTRVIAFERRRDRPEERERYGATITRDIAIWPPRDRRRPTLTAHARPGRPGRIRGHRRDDPAHRRETNDAPCRRARRTDRRRPRPLRGASDARACSSPRRRCRRPSPRRRRRSTLPTCIAPRGHPRRLVLVDAGSRRGEALRIAPGDGPLRPSRWSPGTPPTPASGSTSPTP